jgi:hypothetical protein
VDAWAAEIPVGGAGDRGGRSDHPVARAVDALLGVRL